MLLAPGCAGACQSLCRCFFWLPAAEAKIAEVLPAAAGTPQQNFKIRLSFFCMLRLPSVSLRLLLALAFDDTTCHCSDVRRRLSRLIGLRSGRLVIDYRNSEHVGSGSSLPYVVAHAYTPVARGICPGSNALAALCTTTSELARELPGW